TRVAAAHARYGPAVRSCQRRRGCAVTAAATPTGIRIDVYLELKARPRAIPASVHQASRAPAASRAARSARTMKYRVSAVVASSGASGVASTSPAAANGIVVMISEARSAAASPAGASRRASDNVHNPATSPATTGPNRTASGVAPLTAGAKSPPSRINHAIIGG